MTRTAPDPLFDELRAIYADADALYAGWSCDASTDCCHFGRTGREPYVTSIELAYLERARRSSPPRRHLPTVGERVEERRCVNLGADGRCVVYANRPLGCRTFYCDRATPGEKVKHRDINALVARLRELAKRHAPGGENGRPLSRSLRS